MKVFLIALIFEIISTWGFFHRISGDTNDGHLIYGLLFWAMVALYVLIDLVWVGLLLWKAWH